MVTSSRGGSVPRTSTGLSSTARARKQSNDASNAERDSKPVEAEAEAEKAQPEKKSVFVRFWNVIWNVLTSSWINVLLVFCPVGIAVHFVGASDGIIFAMNAIAIVPLAGLLAHATESVAKRLGDTVGALMNVTFGNAVELIIFIIALVKDEIRIVQASLLGSILSNLLLILGMCFVLGGLRFREQIYNSTVTQMSACLLSLSVISLLLPTAFHASFSSTTQADTQVLKVSRGTSVILLLVYFLYLLFQLNSHAYMYESTPQHVIDRESVPGPAADFFESSDSSDSDSSSGSDSDSSGHSFSTARRIKRAIRKGKRSRKQSMVSAEAEKPTNISVPSSAVETPSESVERTLSEPTASSSHESAPTQLTDEAVQALDGDQEGKKRRKHKHKKHRKEREQAEDAEAAATAGAVTAPNELDGTDNTKRVDFALAPDLEAQPGNARPKPFSLRTLRPNLAKNFTQNVFTSPPTVAMPAAPRQQPRPLRRTQSLPSQHQSYRGQPGAMPPIVPIVVNSQPRTTTADEEDEEPEISRTSAVLLLLGSTALVALCAEFMVDAIDGVVSGNSGLSEAFVGLILLPIVGNAAEHVTAVTVAIKNKLDLAIGVAIGSSIQIALFVTPLVVILGWIMNKDMSLYFTLFETISMFVSAFIVNFLVLDGRSNYLEGSLLCAAYIIIAVAAFFYPDSDEANSIGGGSDETNSTNAEVANLMARGVMGMLGWQ